MRDRPLILILSASAGTGHTVAAAALEQALRNQAPHCEVETLDVLQLSNTFFRKLYADGYIGIVRYAPTAMGVLYDTMDRQDRRFSELLRLAIQNSNRLPTTRYLMKRRPELIINTHFLPAEIVAQMRRAGRLETPQVTVTTDYETHRLWAQSPTDRYYTATAEGKAYLATWGAPPDDIRVTGIPVREAFLQPVDRDAFRRANGLDSDRPLVLLLCGGFGVGPTTDLLNELLRMPVDTQIAVIAGRNEGLRARLAAQIRRAQRTVKVLGFTDQMHAWMRSADLAVSKPGGLTVAESLVCGVPLVIVNPIPGQEARNSDYLLERGAAIKVNHVRLLGFRVSRLLADAPRLAALRAAAQASARPNAASEIVADALTLIRDPLI